MAQRTEVLAQSSTRPQKWPQLLSDHRTPLIVGLALRLLLIPTATYIDLHAIAYALHLLPYEGVTNVYEYLHDLDLSSSPVPLFGTEFFTYPPLAYFSLGGLMGLLRPLYTDAFASAVSAPIDTFVTYRPQVFLWLTLYKLPFLAFDLGIAAVLGSLFYDRADRRLAVGLWLLNPVTLIGSYLFGQFDVIPAFFVLLSFLAARRGNPWWAAVLLGVAASFKTYPLMLLPFLAVVLGRGVWHRVLLLAVGLAPFVLSLLPVLTSSVALNLVFNSGPAQRVFQASVNLGDVLDKNGAIYIFFVLYTMVLLHAWSKGGGRVESLWRYQLAVLVLAYGFSFAHLQWLIWSLPFLVMDWVQRPQHQVLHLVMIGSAIAAALIWQFGPLLEFFSPLGLPWTIPSLWEMVSLIMDPLQFANIMRSIFAGAAVVWVYLTIVRESDMGPTLDTLES